MNDDRVTDDNGKHEAQADSVLKYENLLVSKGRSLAKRLCHSAMDAEDFASELRIGLLQALSKHNPDLLKESVYAFIVVERDCASIVRHWKAKCRCPNGATVAVSEVNTMITDSALAVLPEDLSSRLDIGTFLDSLPHITRRVALLITEGNCAFVQRRLNMTRSQVRHQLGILRQKAEEFGLGAYFDQLQQPDGPASA